MVRTELIERMSHHCMFLILEKINTGIIIFCMNTYLYSVVNPLDSHKWSGWRMHSIIYGAAYSTCGHFCYQLLHVLWEIWQIVIQEEATDTCGFCKYLEKSTISFQFYSLYFVCIRIWSNSTRLGYNAYPGR